RGKSPRDRDSCGITSEGRLTITSAGDSSGTVRRVAQHTMLKQQRQRSRRARGLTLIEVLVATTVLTTAVLGLANVAVSTSELRSTGMEKAAALHAVERELAAVEATNFATILAVHNGRGFS